MNRLISGIKILLVLLFITAYSCFSQNAITISPLGFGGAKIILDETVIYTDLANINIDTNNIIQYFDADFILISHADWDHFSPKWVSEIAKKTGAKIIGPPSITYPLLADFNVNKEQLMIFYPNQPQNPIDTTIRNIDFKIYQTEHFNDWKPVHISFLISYKGEKIYFSGDSYNNLTTKPSYLQGEIDIVLANFVEGTDEPIKYIEKFKQLESTISYKYLFPLHLINCDFTISPELLKANMTKNSLLKVKLITQKNNVFSLN